MEIHVYYTKMNEVANARKYDIDHHMSP